jgi:hypothetical protein
MRELTHQDHCGMFNGIPLGFTKGVMAETPWGAVCPGMFLSVLMIGGKCSPFRAKAAHISGHLPRAGVKALLAQFSFLHHASSLFSQNPQTIRM